MGLSRNKVAVSEGAAGSPPFYGERAVCQKTILYSLITNDEGQRVSRSTYREMNVVQYSVNNDLLRVSVTNAEGPPVPIPNTEVKLCSGENTLRETVRENSSMLT